MDSEQSPTSSQPNCRRNHQWCYVFGDSELDNAAISIGGLITRVGLDGAWVGAYEHKS
jgi:hypothetical protein